MAKQTLLELVQTLMSDMESDEVNSIDDTVESEQVARIVGTTYNEIINSRYWPHLSVLTQLHASTDNTKPTHMHMPDAFQYLESVRYDVRTSVDGSPKYQTIQYLCKEDFLNLINGRSLNDANTIAVIDDYVTLLIKTNTAPTYWTSFDDETIIFDSYNSDVDDTLQKSKTQAIAYKEAAFTFADDFVPDLPDKAFPYLLAEAKSIAFHDLKQMPNQKAEQQSRRQRIWLAQEKYRQNKPTLGPGYGRK